MVIIVAVGGEIIFFIQLVKEAFFISVAATGIIYIWAVTVVSSLFTVAVIIVAPLVTVAVTIITPVVTVAADLTTVAIIVTTVVAVQIRTVAAIIATIIATTAAVGLVLFQWQVLVLYWPNIIISLFFNLLKMGRHGPKAYGL